MTSIDENKMFEGYNGLMETFLTKQHDNYLCESSTEIDQAKNH